MRGVSVVSGLRAKPIRIRPVMPRATVADATSKIAQATSRLGRAEHDWFAAIRSAHAEGWSITAIARAAGAPEAEVREIVKQPSSTE